MEQESKELQLSFTHFCKEYPCLQKMFKLVYVVVGTIGVYYALSSLDVLIHIVKTITS